MYLFPERDIESCHLGWTYRAYVWLFSCINGRHYLIIFHGISWSAHISQNLPWKSMLLNYYQLITTGNYDGPTYWLSLLKGKGIEVYLALLVPERNVTLSSWAAGSSKTRWQSKFGCFLRHFLEKQKKASLPAPLSAI